MEEIWGKGNEKWKQIVKESGAKQQLYKPRKTQARVAAAVQMFLSGNPVQVRSSFLPSSIIIIFIIPLCNFHFH